MTTEEDDTQYFARYQVLSVIFFRHGLVLVSDIVTRETTTEDVKNITFQFKFKK